MGELLRILSGLSAPTLATLAVVALSLVWTILWLISIVVRAVLSLLPKRQAEARSSPPSSPVPSAASPASKAQAQKQGVSLKQLLKDQKKKPGGGSDRHSANALFINTLKGHSDAINGLAFSPTGTALVTACDDRTVRVFNLQDVYAKSIPFRHKELKRGTTDVAFGDDDAHVAVLTSGTAGSAGLCMLDWPANGAPVAAWEKDKTHGILPGFRLRSVASTKGGHGVIVSSTAKTDIKVFSPSGAELATIDTGGWHQTDVALSRDGRWVAAATFTSDVKVYELTFDRGGAFTGASKAMDLKGHRRKVLCLDFSPDLKKMVTVSEDGTLKVWDINVRYALREDPKELLSAGLALVPNQFYSRVAWGPDGYIAAVHGSMVHILDSRSGEVVERIEDAHDTAITAIEWAPTKLAGPQGRVSVLATGGSDGRVRLWRAPPALL